MPGLVERIREMFADVERYDWEMHLYQAEADEFLDKTPYAALFIDTGLGKTIIVLTFLARMLRRGYKHKILIIGPVRVVTQTWPNEVRVWSHTASLQVSVIRAEDDDPEVIAAGAAAAAKFDAREDAKALKAERKDAAIFAVGKEQVMALRGIPSREATRQKAETKAKEAIRIRKMNSPAPIHLINREQLTWLVDQFTQWKISKKTGKRVRVIVGWPYRVVAVDEASGFKDYASARFKALAAVRQQGFLDRLILLTATPNAEGYMGMFALGYLLDLGERLGRMITHYRTKYFDPHPYVRHVFKLKPGADEWITDKIADICMVMKAGDYLDEEDPLFPIRHITLTDAELAQYKAFKRDFVLTLPATEEGGEEELIEAKTAGSLCGKLLQLASGAVYTADKETRLVHNHKIEDLAQLIEELDGSPLMVSYWYKSSLKRLKAAFPDAIQMDKEGKKVKPWNEGKIKILLVHPASVGHGLNMQYGPGHDLYMFDHTWSWELFYQLYRRIARQGQKKRVRVHMPIVRGTDEEGLVKKLGKKEDAQNWFFERIKQIRRKMANRK